MSGLIFLLLLLMRTIVFSHHLSLSLSSYFPISDPNPIAESGWQFAEQEQRHRGSGGKSFVWLPIYSPLNPSQLAPPPFFFLLSHLIS